MKVDLDENGTLSVKSENAVESFALSQWFQLWVENKTTFYVETKELAGGTFQSKMEKVDFK